MPDGKDTKYLPTSWYDPRVEIRPSSIQGGGMFARAQFQPGETVAIVGGTLMTGAEFAAYLASVERWNAHQIGEDLHLVDLIQTPNAVKARSTTPATRTCGWATKSRSSRGEPSLLARS